MVNFVFFFKITTGPLCREVNNDVQQVDDHTANLKVGLLKALNLLNWDQTLVIGKMTAINHTSVTIHQTISGRVKEMWRGHKIFPRK